ncbi:MAG: Ig domain-containing protein [Bacteroidota bacterium]
MSAFNCTNQSNRSCDECGELQELNRVIHVAYVKKGVTITTSSAAAMAAAILAAELACNAVVIREVNGTYDGGAVSVGKGFGKEPERVLGMAHTLVYADKDYVANVEFYNDFKFVARGYDMYFMTDTKAWKVVGTALSIAPKGAITDDNKTYIEGEITVKWNFKNNPLPYSIDTDDFEECPELNLTVGTLVTYVNSAGITYTIAEDTAGGSLDLSSTASGTLVFSLLTGTLPAGLSLNAATGTITGTPTAAGSSSLTFQVENACGIKGTLDIIIVIS